MSFLPPLVLAAGSFSVTPGKQEVILVPGAGTIKNLSITNNLGHSAEFILGVEDIATSGTNNQGVDLLGETLSPYSLKRYLSLPTTKFTLHDGESKNIPIAINLSANVPPGSLHGAVTVAASSAGVGVAKVTARLTSLWFLRVEGPVKESGQLVDFGPLGGHWQLFTQQLRFQFSFRNDGNVYLNPYGGIELKPLIAWGGVRSVVVPPNFVLPGSTRVREVMAPAGTFCGWYKLTLKLNRGYQDKVDEQNSSLIVCGPVMSGLVLGVVILLLGFLIGWLVVKLRRGKQSLDIKHE